MIYRVLVLVLFISLYSGGSFSQKIHGLAMHGIPKYDSNYTHLSYVNPDAPKGGALRFGVYGSYDNLKSCV